MAPSMLAQPRYVIEPLVVVAEPHHAPVVGEQMSRQPSLPSLTNRGNLVRTSHPERTDNQRVVLDVEHAPPGAGVKVVRPRLRLRALHPDPAALLARARAYEDNATVNATKSPQAQQPLDKPRSFTDAALCASTLGCKGLLARRSVLQP
jgi:hypothetical protein